MKHRIAFLNLSLVLLFACRRNDVPAPVTPAPAAPTRLARYFVLRPNNSGGMDTFTRASITYDAQGRPSRFTRTEFYNGGTTDTMRVLRIQYYYGTPADTLAYRFDEIPGTVSGGGPNSYEHHLTWSGGQLLRDSIWQPTSYLRNVEQFTYNGNAVYRLQAFRYQGITGPENVVDSARYYGTWQGDNLTYQLDTLTETAANGDLGFERNEHSTTYRQEANPFFVLTRPVFRKALYTLDPVIEEWNMAPRHLLTQRVVKQKTWGMWSPDQGTFTLTYTYTFDANGRVVRILENSGPSIFDRRIELEYQ